MKAKVTRRRYTDDDILTEARLFCELNMSIADIAKSLGIPLATVSWHLLYPLKNLNYRMWITVRYRCFAHTRKPERYLNEEDVCKIEAMVDNTSEHVDTLFKKLKEVHHV